MTIHQMNNYHYDNYDHYKFLIVRYYDSDQGVEVASKKDNSGWMIYEEETTHIGDV